jgi:hypothetical protein
MRLIYHPTAEQSVFFQSLAEEIFQEYISLVMTTKEQALTAISELPDNTDLLSIIRELSFLAGIEEASREIRAGEGMDSHAAKKKLREWIGA